MGWLVGQSPVQFGLLQSRWTVESGSYRQFLTENRAHLFSGILEWILTLNFRVEILQYCTSYKSVGIADWGLKPKVFNSKSTMGRLMGPVSKSKSHPDFQGQDLLSWTGYKSAGIADWGLTPKVFNSKSTMGRRMDPVSKSKSLPDFQGQDLLSWTGYKSAEIADWGLTPKVFNSKSTMGRRMDPVSKSKSLPDFQGQELKTCYLERAISQQE